jgi:hypothetical protein
LAVEEAHQVFQDLGLKNAIVFGKHPLERLKLGLDGGHRIADQLGEVGAAGGGFAHDPIVAGLFRQPKGPPAKVAIYFSRFRQGIRGLDLLDPTRMALLG